ncbi:MAG: tRNA (adenine(22)-N(1))-methyltransferase TrmK [Erysipelotrichaceae bacterium]|nr:tRNA (adenine(22)-N(1))-methyltransferase TrmK [Erysipelotrichaceae bacterium]
MISKRIKTIAGLIHPDENVLDVGTDHAFLPIQLKLNGHRGKIAATELRKGPRNNAVKNLEEAGIDDVEVYLTPGVRGIDFAADVVVIAGMGLTTVTGIISDDPEYFADKRIIIQINHEMDRLRCWLMENSFMIENEVIIRDYKYYEILIVCKGQMHLDDMQIRFGPVLLREKSQTFIDCYSRKAEKLEMIIDSLPEQHPDREKLQKQLETVKEALN